MLTEHIETKVCNDVGKKLLKCLPVSFHFISKL